MSKSGTGQMDEANEDKNWTTHAKHCVNEYNSTIHLPTLKLALEKELDFVYTNNKNESMYE